MSTSKINSLYLNICCLNVIFVNSKSRDFQEKHAKKILKVNLDALKSIRAKKGKKVYSKTKT